ncbi:hypothetical protein TNCV_165771 [Trichonephila clavipes]|nr:hypothetical protein TNCV_165771 [Trichonephila clavipes]
MGVKNLKVLCRCNQEEFCAGEDDNLRTAPIKADKGILEIVQSSKDIIDADLGDGNEKNDADPVLMSSEMRNIMKSTRSYLDAHSDNEMNNKMDGIEQFVDYLLLKKAIQRIISYYFLRT